ncbi:MAG: glycogen/starch synthase [Candidatus Izimaplasma sp.]|nr:glycogen/starch synthase [Candidatus Izimaplasma bacterium]
MSDLFAIIDATNPGDLERLTLHRMPGALPFAGKFRVIDFNLSNMANSNIINVSIFPYGNYRSLQDHIGSGKRYNLDRRRDGLFVLPPKNMSALPSEMLTFQRMNEHIEYFRRSNQSHCIITQAHLVWNIDFYHVLKMHLKYQNDITEVVYRDIRLKTFLLSKKLLLKYIKSYESQEYKTIIDVCEKAPNLKKGIYKHKGYTRTITNTFHYLKSNLDILKFDIGRRIFKEDRPIYSKEKTAPPAVYQNDARAINSMVASGSIINGTLKNTIIGRDTIIKKGAIIKNSFIMSNCVIEEDVVLENTIIDKETVIKQGTNLSGTIQNPFCSEKQQILTNKKSQRILMVAAESYPYIKTGGLADVIGSLSNHLVRQGTDVNVILPLYKKIKESFKESLKRGKSFTITYNNTDYQIRLFNTTYKKVSYYFVESYDFFDTGKIYGLANDLDRFAFFNKAVVSLLDYFDHFDLIHLHDWHTALIPVLIENQKRTEKTLLTIHNIDYQGTGSSYIFKKLSLPNIYNLTQINFLKLGILQATKISTVSPTYKEELKYDYYGKNLTPNIISRERDFYGILNGISAEHNPATDKLIHTTFDKNSLQNKAKNKRFLQKDNELEVSDDTFIVGMVTRIVEQKGFDIILPVIEQLIGELDMYFIILGTGDKRYMNWLKEIKKAYPNKVGLNLKYDATVPNYIYAGSDLFLMPSRVEPCGLGQMIAQRYGTIPLVRETGGLKDSVNKFDEVTRRGDGFSFYNYDIDSLKDTLLKAYNLYNNDKDMWLKLIDRSMRIDNSISKCAIKYQETYKLIIDSEK